MILPTINQIMKYFSKAEHYFMGGKHLRETLKKYVKICLAFSKLSFHMMQRGFTTGLFMLALITHLT